MNIETRGGMDTANEEEAQDPYKNAEQMKEALIERFPDKFGVIEDVFSHLNSIEGNHEEIEPLHMRMRSLLDKNYQISDDIRGSVLFNMLLGSKLEQDRWDVMTFDTAGKIVTKLFYEEIQGGNEQER